MEIMQNRVFLVAVLVCGIAWGINGYLAIHRIPKLITKAESNIESNIYKVPTVNLPASTSDWKTFSNPDWGISVQYPSSYKGGGVQEELHGGSPIVLATFTPPNYVTEYSTTITLGVQQKSWASIDELYKYEQTYGQHVKSLNRIKVNGLPALEVVSAFGPPEPEDHKVYILYGDTTYYFDFDGSTNDPDYPDFLKMLSTFEIEDRV